MRTVRTAALAALLVISAACSGARPVPSAGRIAIDPPVFRAQQILPQEADANGVTLAIFGEIENPNPVRLPVARFTWAIDALGKRAGAGQLTSDLVLPAAGTVPVRVPLRLSWANVPDFLGMLAVRESLAFTVHGAAWIRADRGLVELPYSVDGAVVLPRLPAVALHDAVVREAGLLHTVVELRVDVSNPNPFPLPVGRLAYDFSISGVPVAQAARSSLEPIPANGQATIVVPVQFSSVGAAAGALSGVMRGRADVALSGRAGYGALEVGVDARAALGGR